MGFTVTNTRGSIDLSVGQTAALSGITAALLIDLQLFEAPSLTCYYISMNMNKAPFDNQQVRDAINYAIDRQLIIDTIASGSGEPADAIIAPAVFGYYSPGAYEYDRS